MTRTSVETYSRAVGIFLVLTMVGGWFGEVQIPSQFMTGDSVTTAGRLREQAALFRLGFAAYLVEAFSDVVLLWLFYVLLKPVDRDLALLSAFFGLVAMTTFAVMKMFYFSAPIFIDASRYTTGLSPEQNAGLSTVFLRLYGRLTGAFMLFYGTAWIIRGYLTIRSGFLPRFLGALMIAAGVGFFTKNVTKVLLPEYSSDLLLIPMGLNVLVLAIWMLVKGVDRDKWHLADARIDER